MQCTCLDLTYLPLRVAIVSLRPITRIILVEKKVHEHFHTRPGALHAVLYFRAGHLYDPYKFAHFLPVDSPYPAVRAVVTEA